VSRRVRQQDPTAQAAINSPHDDPIGVALGELEPRDAIFLVAHTAFQIPIAILVRALKRVTALPITEQDLTGCVNDILARGADQLRAALDESIGDLADLNWATSPKVQQIGRDIGLTNLEPCRYCGREAIALVQPVGRYRQYCSNSCRQAAYRRRRSDLAEVKEILSDVPMSPEGVVRIPPVGPLNLIFLLDAGAVGIRRVRLKDRKITNEKVADAIEQRWDRESPRRRCAHAALSYLEDEGVDIDTVHLHGINADHRAAGHYIGFEFDLIDTALFLFQAHPDMEWLEIPDPSHEGVMWALRIRITNHELFLQLTEVEHWSLQL
jgi:hypothetical protein